MKTHSSFFFIQVFIISLLILISFQSYNQIIYIDVDPDTTITETGGFYNIDIDEDNNEEFKIVLTSSEPFHGGVHVRTLNDSSYISSIMVDCEMAIEYQLNDSIGSVGGWKNDLYTFYLMASLAPSTCLHPGLFIGDTDVFLGLKWEIKHINYFGWLRVDVSSEGNWFTIKDLAYAPFPILAGQESTSSVNEHSLTNQIIISEFDNRLNVRAKDNVKFISAHLIDLLAREFSVEFYFNEIIIIKNQLKPGVYLLYLSTNKGFTTLKLLVN